MNLVHTNSFSIQNSAQFVVRNVQIGDVDKIRKLFADTVTNVCSNDYNPEQIAAWAASAADRFKWIERLSEQFSLVACFNNALIGFVSLNNYHHLDLLYVHKSYLQQGIGRRLYADVEAYAEHYNQPFITTDASITARPFFERIGFELMQTQEVVAGSVIMPNYRMQKKLS